MILGGGIAAFVVVAAVLAVNLPLGGNGGGPGPGPTSFDGLTTGSFTAQSPWRLVVRNNDARTVATSP